MGEMELDDRLNAVSEAVIGAAIAVHRELGPGYQEVFYQNALEIEFKRRSIKYVREARFKVMYAGQQIGEGRLDFLVEDCVIVETKASEGMTPLFTAQVISYLKATGCRLALLINFNTQRSTEGLKRVAR